MSFRVCKWSGCYEMAEHRDVLCDEHKGAVRLVFRTILNLGFSREVAIKWTWKLAPYVVVRDQEGTWQITNSVTTSIARKALLAVGLGERSCYERLARLNHVALQEISALSFIAQTIADGEWVMVSEAAQMVGTTHRYLRHLVYETKIPRIVALTRVRIKTHRIVGFYRTELPKLKQEVEKVNKRRTP